MSRGYCIPDGAAGSTAQFYNFTGDPGAPETKSGYAILTDASDLEIGRALTNPQPLMEAALFCALLAAIVIVAGCDVARYRKTPA
jgi:hypothetical protein